MKIASVLRCITAVLVIVLCMGGAAVFAETDGEQAGETVVPGTEEQQAEPEDKNEEPGKKLQIKARIVKKGKYYYYAKAGTGEIRKKKGFVDCDGKRYYIQKGGKIATGQTLKLFLSKYHIGKKGAIKCGAHKWGKKWYFSDPKTGKLRKKKGFVKSDGERYYVINKKGQIMRNRPFVDKNLPYEADKHGCCRPIEIEKYKNKVITVAQKQVGNMTGKKYWKWYFRSVFVDTDRTPWCGTFVAWCYNKGGKYSKISKIKRYGNLGYVPSYSRFASSKHKWIKQKKAAPGDIIVIRRSHHVGLVERVYKGYIFTIEGNSGPTARIGCKKPGAVTRGVFKIGDKDITGVIRP